MTATGVLARARPAAAIRWAPVLVRFLLGAVILFTVAGLGLIVVADAAIGWSGFETADVAVFAVAFPALPVVGALLASRRPGNPIGWLFLGASLSIAVTAFAHGYGDYALDARPESLPGAAFVTWWQWAGWPGFAALAIFVPLLFPTGRLPSARWRPVAVLGVVATAAVAASLALRPGSLPDFGHTANPLGLTGSGGVFDVIDAVAEPLVLLALVGAIASLVSRYWAGDAQLRGQLAWLAAAGVVLVAVDVTGTVLLGGGFNDHPALCTWGAAAAKPVYGIVVPAVLYAGLPVAVAVAVLRRDLYDLHRFLRRSAVYAALCAAIALAYASTAWALGVTVTGALPVPIAVAVTIAATLAFSPARRRLERAADRVAFGARPSGYEVAAGFGAVSGTMTDLDDLATSLAHIAHRGLGVEWTRVNLALPANPPETARQVAGLDTGATADLEVTVRHLDCELGSIACGPAADPRRHTENRALLELLAHEAGLAVHTMTLARSLSEHVRTVDAQALELAASRARLVHEQEAERRRLERDIHDGAQQDLVAMIVRLGIARELVARDAAAALGSLEELQRDAKAALIAIRELAQGIHPSVLGDEGLVTALEGRAARLPLEVAVQADPATRARRFPDAVEGGAYFVACEALANVLKHAAARRATVTVAATEATLTVEVRDDGCGFAPDDVNGCGLTNLADRMGGLGGTLTIRSVPGAGTTVTARLPVAGGATSPGADAG